MAGHSRRLAPINRGAVNGTACHFCRRTARPTLMLGRDARARRFCRPGHWNSTGSRLAPCKGADYRCRTRPTCSTKATQSHGRSRRGAAALRRARGKMPSSRRCREVFAARQDDIEKVITGAEHGQPAARQQGVAVSRCASPCEGKNAFVGGVAKCLRPGFINRFRFRNRCLPC